MLRQYIAAAMGSARFEQIEDDHTYYGEIRGFDGVFANADTHSACIEQLEEVLEDWILLGIAEGHPLPEIAGITIDVKKSA